ncbi:hypothetical protein EUTSA_v10023135mg, partial [Eutrema salsugineum]
MINERPLKGILNIFLVFSIALVISLIRIQVIHLLGGQALTLLGPIIGWYAVGWQALPSTGPNGAESWEESTFELDVLEESFSPTAEEAQTEEGEPSVNQGAGPSVPYPYGVDEMIGGGSVRDIQRRLLAAFASPSYEVIQLTRIQAEDLFEVKVEIVKIMALYDPRGDWMGRGARALDNPRTAMGEESLDRLF